MKREINTTKDLKIFSTINGNRGVNQDHVSELRRLIERHGNRTFENPILVDEELNVIDGQHRLAALKQLEGEVAYVVIPNADIELVRTLNQGGKRWDWRDFAASYAHLGNTEYQWFLEYVDEYQLKFTQALTFATQTIRGHYTPRFNSGELKVANKPVASHVARQWVEVRDTLELSTKGESLIAIGWYLTARGDDYDHARMLKKLGEVVDFRSQATYTEYARQFEEIYNRNYSIRTRLF